MNAPNLDSYIVHHPNYSEAKSALNRVVTKTALPLSFLLGSTGIGKSTLLAELRNELSLEAKPGDMPVLLLSSPAPASGDSSRLVVKVYQQLASALASGDRAPNTTRMPDGLREHVESMIRLSATSVLIFDNADYLPKSKATVEILREINEHLGCRIILSGTSELHPLVEGLSLQVINVVPFLTYGPEAAARERFRNILKKISAAFRETSKPFETHEEDVFRGCSGSIGLLMTWISLAKRGANMRKSREVEWDDFLAARLSPRLLNTVIAQDAIFRGWQKQGPAEQELESHSHAKLRH